MKYKMIILVIIFILGLFLGNLKFTGEAYKLNSRLYTISDGSSNSAALKTDTTVKCVDSDNGLDYFTKGSVNYNNINYTDSCTSVIYGLKSLYNVTEYYCLNDNSVKNKLYNCSIIGEGYACIDGSCKKMNVNCTDSDNGLDYFTKGIAKSTDGSFLVDSCVGLNYVVESYCTNISLGQIAVKSLYNCTNLGYICNNGICDKDATTTTTLPPSQRLKRIVFQDGLNKYSGTTDAHWNLETTTDMTKCDIQTGSNACIIYFKDLFGLDKNQLPYLAEIKNASLYLNTVSRLGGDKRIIVDTYRITDNKQGLWNELRVDAKYRDKILGGYWSNYNGDYDPNSLITTTFFTSPQGYIWVNLDITEHLIKWQQGEPNQGIFMSISPYSEVEMSVIRSSEYFTQNLRPKLVVYYTLTL